MFLKGQIMKIVNSNKSFYGKEGKLLWTLEDEGLHKVLLFVTFGKQQECFESKDVEVINKSCK
jgi:hypothetical protein